jgi:hypothetical protein
VLPEEQEPNRRATVSAPDEPEHPADAPDSIWRSRLVEYFPLLDEWSQEGASKRAVVTLSPRQAAFCRTSQPAALAETGVTAFADDDVVEDVHADQPAGIDQVA